jgi:hypothetical protein
MNLDHKEGEDDKLDLSHVTDEHDGPSSLPPLVSTGLSLQ